MIQIDTSKQTFPGFNQDGCLHPIWKKTKYSDLTLLEVWILNEGIAPSKNKVEMVSRF